MQYKSELLSNFVLVSFGSQALAVDLQAADTRGTAVADKMLVGDVVAAVVDHVIFAVFFDETVMSRA